MSRLRVEDGPGELGPWMLALAFVALLLLAAAAAVGRVQASHADEAGVAAGPG
jgi:hypothetical protein